MDIEDTLAPKSEQMDAIELTSGPRTFTIERITDGSPDQPVNIHFVEFPRPWRPSKNMRRVIDGVWELRKRGVKKWSEASELLAGRRITLYYDPAVRFGSNVVGGVRVSHMSHIDAQTKTPIIPSQGKSALWTVDPLPELSRVDQLRAKWKHATSERKGEIEAEVARLTAPVDAPVTAEGAGSEGGAE
jgi:hypothetical protein